MSRFTYTVSGRGEFPLDMLRYDECGFATQADRSSALGELVPSTHVPGRRNIEMVSESGRHPTVGRWESFGWTVIGAGIKPVPAQPAPTTRRSPPRFPVELRKMWSGREVQEWINEHWDKQ